MPNLSLRELATVIDGSLSLGDLPPLDGDQQTVSDIDFNLNNLSPNGLYWDLSHSRKSGFGKPELAFAKGSAGVLTEHEDSEPWAGRYALRVTNCQFALRQLAYFLRQRARQQALLLFPAAAVQRKLAAIRTLLEIPANPDSLSGAPSFGTASHIGTSSVLRIHALTNLTDASLPATLLLATPDLIILGRPDAAWLGRQSRPTLYGIIESLAPDGAILYCDLPEDACPAEEPANPRPAWMKVFATTGIRCLRVGSDYTADFQVQTSISAQMPYSLKIGHRCLRLPARSFAEVAAAATALSSAILLDCEPTSLVRRLGLSYEDRPASPTFQRPRKAA